MIKGKDSFKKGFGLFSVAMVKIIAIGAILNMAETKQEFWFSFTLAAIAGYIFGKEIYKDYKKLEE